MSRGFAATKMKQEEEVLHQSADLRGFGIRFGLESWPERESVVKI